MANEFIIKNGFHSKGDSQITGSLTGTSGTLNEFSASYALTASHALTATTSPAGNNQEVQFNNSGVLAGNTNFKINNSTGIVSMISGAYFNSSNSGIIKYTSATETLGINNDEDSVNIKIAGYDGGTQLRLGDDAVGDGVQMSSSLGGINIQGSITGDNQFTLPKLNVSASILNFTNNNYKINATNATSIIFNNDDRSVATRIKGSDGVGSELQVGDKETLVSGSLHVKDFAITSSKQILLNDSSTNSVASTTNRILTPTYSTSGPGYPLLIQPGDSTAGSGGTGAHAYFQGGNATNASSAGNGGNVYIIGGTSSTTSSNTGSIFLKGNTVNLDNTSLSHYSNDSNNRVVLSYDSDYVSIGIVSYNASGGGPFGIKFFADGVEAFKIDGPSGQKAIFQGSRTGQHTEVRATSGSFSYLRGASPLKIDVGSDTLEIASSNFGVTTTGEMSSGTGEGISTTSITSSGAISSSGKFIGSELFSHDDLTLDADGADILLKDSGTEFGRFKRDSSNFVIKSATSDKDIIFKGDSGGGTVTSLTLDMSDAGSATFNNNITASGAISSSGTVTGANLTATSLTDGQIVLAGTNGRLSGDTALQFDSSNDILKLNGDAQITGSLNISGSTTIELPTGTAFEVLEGDKDQQSRLIFDYSNGDPTLTVASRASTAKMVLRQDTTTNGLYLDENGQIYVNNSTSDGVKINGTTFAPIGTNANALDLGSDTRPFKDLYLQLGGDIIYTTSNENMRLQHINPNQLRISGSDGVAPSFNVLDGSITSSTMLIEGGGLDIKNNGAQSYARFYCESSNAHYTELKAQPHALYSGNPVTLLPSYDFDFRKPFFGDSSTTVNITSSGAISASGDLIGNQLQIGGGTFTSASLASAVAGEGESYDLNATTNGSDVNLNLTSTSGTDNSLVTLVEGNNITLTRDSATQITIDAAGGGGGGVFSQVGSTTQFSTTSSLLVSGSNSAASASLEVHGSGSNIFKVEGSVGTLFSVDDGLDDIIFAANNISGTPVISANADNTVKLGKLGGFGIVISGSTPAPSDALANIIITGSIQHSGSYGLGVAASTTFGRFDASNDVVAFSTSDENLKENITPIEDALNKVSQIQGVEFDWKSLSDEEKMSIHGNEGHDVGVIAQEIEKVLPEVVTTRDNGYKAVKYEKIIPLLVEAIKELQAEVQELKNSK